MADISRPAVLDLIGNTPLVEVTRFDAGPCRLFLKLESQNPGGSIRDRIDVAMIEAAERDGRLAPDGTVVEATAGNTIRVARCSALMASGSASSPPTLRRSAWPLLPKSWFAKCASGNCRCRSETANSK